ncbi:primosomal protein N' [candidate division KSB1 bacterium]|nr:primosomal protein N' [candidate division KSB1 bacterium]
MPDQKTPEKAQILFPHPPYQRFTYHIPDCFREVIELGHRVLVPLGNRRLTGYVVEFVENEDIHKLRDIEDILDSDPLLTPELLKLTAWIAQYYICSWGEVIRAALPPGLNKATQLVIKKNGAPPESGPDLTDHQSAILDALSDQKSLTLKTLQRQFKSPGIRYDLAKLEKMGHVVCEQEMDAETARTRMEKWISLLRKPDEAELTQLKKRAPKQAHILEKLLESEEAIPRSKLDCTLDTINRLVQSDWVAVEEREVYRDPYAELKIKKAKIVRLTAEQIAAIAEVGDVGSEGFQTVLLHGVTSSGKTQVYLELIRKVWEADKSALVLIPEIALTPQAVQRYRAVFGDSVAVLHSRLSQGERYDAWRKLRSGEKRIALGPRSTVFAPLENLGLIVVDEEHETSYKQSDPAPRYHARDVAIMRAKIHNCQIVLGSATPSLESYYNSDLGKYKLCQLTERIDATPMPKISLIDRKPEPGQMSWPVISEQMLDKIKESLEKGEQIILLQNRRGYSVFLRCVSCGTIENCPYCDITLTFHQKDSRLRCHYCGYEKGVPDVCASCGGTQLSFRGVGTQRVEEALKEAIPESRIIRMDLDTTRSKHAHTRLITAFEEGKGDILLGTQMVAKGHDFPGVQMVGIISADTGLHFPDFRAGERTFQLLTQAAGRAGRRNQTGEVLIQTLEPDHPVIQFALEHDYKNFYLSEIKQREALAYPPYGRLAVLHFKGKNEGQTQKAAQLCASLIPRKEWMTCLGPVASPLSRIRGVYRYQIILRSPRKNDPAGTRLRQSVRATFQKFLEKNPYRQVRLTVDVDPMDML